MARRLPPRVPSGLPCPPSPPGAGAASSPPRPLARLPCPWSLSPPAPPPSPAEGGSRAWGGARARAAAAAFALGAGPSRSPRPHGALGASRDARRGGGPPWRLPAVVRVRPPTPGGPQSLGSRGAPAGRCRPPPPALDGSLSLRRTSAPTLPFPAPCLSPPAPPPPRPGLGARVRLLAFPALALSHRLTRPACPCPRFPLQPLALCGERGLGSRVWGGTRVWVKESFGVLGKGEGSGPPRRLWRGVGGKGWGRGRRRVSA